jgi:chromosome segregation ATPase
MALANAAQTGRELLVLRDDVAKNRAEISRLRHELQLASATHQAVRTANVEHATALQAELDGVLQAVAILEGERESPSVPLETVTHAATVLHARRSELQSVLRDVEVLEAAIRKHFADPALHLDRCLRDTHPQLMAVMGLERAS